MSDFKKYLDKDYRVRLYLAASNALYWPIRGSDDEFEPANVEYLSTPTRAFVRLANPEAVKAILQEVERLEKLEEENKQLRKRAADAELAYNNLQMECRRLNEENAQLYAQQDVARDTYEALVAENHQLRATLKDTNNALAVAEMGLQEFDGKITRLEKITKETKAEIAYLQGRESYIAMLEEDLDEVLDQVDADIEEIDRLKKELEIERATNFGEGAWVAVEVYNKVALALAEACDIAENWIRSGALPFNADPLARIKQLRNVGQKCYLGEP